MAIKKKSRTNKIVLLVFVSLALIAMAILTSIPGSPLHSVTSPFSFVLDPVQKTVSGAWNGIAEFYRSVSDARQIQKENESLLE